MERTVKVGEGQAAGNDAEPGELIPRGVFVDVERPEYCDEYQKVIDRAQRVAPSAGAGSPGKGGA